MAKVKRAGVRIWYWMAIVVLSCFSLIGRVGPSWAQEAKSRESAHLFNDELFGQQLAQTEQQTNILKSKPSTDVKERPSTDFEASTQATFKEAERIELNAQIVQKVDETRQNLAKGIRLDTTELLLLQVMENAKQYETLSQQIETLNKILIQQRGK